MPPAGAFLERVILYSRGASSWESSVRISQHRRRGVGLLSISFVQYSVTICNVGLTLSKVACIKEDIFKAPYLQFIFTERKITVINYTE